MVFQFRAVSPNTTSGAQAALMTTWQSCDCYLLPVNGLPHCLTFSLRLRSSFIIVPYFLIFCFFLSLLSLLFFALLLLPSLLLFFVHRQSLSWTRGLSAGFRIQKSSIVNDHDAAFGVKNGTWTHTDFSIRPSNVRVCQFRHPHKRKLFYTTNKKKSSQI